MNPERFDIEAYVNGEASPEEVARLEAALEQDENLRLEVTQQRELIEHLRALQLREQVKNLFQQHPPKSGWNWKILGGLGGFFILCFFGWWNWDNFMKKETQIPAASPQRNAPETKIPSTPPIQPKKEEEIRSKSTYTGPIATVDPSEENGDIQVRGDNRMSNEKIKILVDSIWYNNIPFSLVPASTKFQAIFNELSNANYLEAYVDLELLEKIERKNDTLFYLKGHCLLELKEGAEAARYFDRLDIPGKPWRDAALWSSGLAKLLAGDPKAARQRWQKLLNLPESTYTSRAKSALEKINK